MRNQAGTANNNYRHGLSQHPMFGTWYRMIRRCTVEGEYQYADYGGRGITVCPVWLEPAKYIEYVESELGPKPGSGYSIDRIDNDGDYEPGNVRWATISQQNANQRQRTSPGYPVGALGFKGVRLHKSNGRYQARVHFGGREISVGYFETAEEAAVAHDKKAFELHGDRARLNFPVGAV